LDQALARPTPFVQVATWNDYGEGTAIEPSRGAGFLALETLQRRLRPALPPEALRLPEALLELRRRPPEQAPTGLADRIARLLVAGETAEAARLLSTGR
jgi:hypothetical protein